MKNLKRVLSLGLASVMLVGMMVVGAGAADFTDADEIQHEDAVNTLVALSVINGKEDGSYFDPTGDVTRAEMAKMIAVAMNGGSEDVVGVKTVPTFTDISTNWAQPYIEYCADLGIISGRGDGTFDPEGKVTGMEATKMVLTALGYDAEAYKLIGTQWSVNTDQLARTADPSLYEELSGVSMNANATRDTAAQIIWNGLLNTTRRVEPSQNTSTGEVTWTYKEGDTLLYERYNAYTAEGTYMGNSDSISGLDDGFIRITVSGTGTTLDGNHDFPSDLGIENIGEEVRIVWKNGTRSSTVRADKNDVIYGVFNTGRTEVYNITMNDIQDADTDANDYIKFDDSLHAAKASISVVTNYISSSASTITPATVNKNDGSGWRNQSINKIKFTCDPDDGKISNAYVTTVGAGKVTSLTSTKATITNLGTITLADNDVYDDIAKDDVVYFTRFYNADDVEKAFVTVTLAEKVEGTLTGYKYDSGKYVNVVVDGTTYKINGKPASLPSNLTDDAISVPDSSDIGDEVAVYLADGMVVALQSVEDSGGKYALIMEASGSTATVGAVIDGVKVNVLLPDGTEGVYTVHKDSTSNGTTALERTDVATPGTLVEYSSISNGYIKIKSVEGKYTSGDVLSYTGDVKTTAVQGTKVTTTLWDKDKKTVLYTTDSGTSTTTDVAASNAVLFVARDTGGTAGSIDSADEFKAYSIRGLGNITTVVEDKSENTKGDDVTQKVSVYLKDGLVQAAYIVVSEKPKALSSTTLYGIVSSYEGTREIDDVTYNQYKVAVNAEDGEKLVVNVEENGDPLDKTTGAIVMFDERADACYDKSDFTILRSKAGEVDKTATVVAVDKYDESNRLLTYFEKTAKASVDEVSYKGYNQKSITVDKDVQIIYINADDKKDGEAIGVNQFNSEKGYPNVIFTTDDGLVDVIIVNTTDTKVNWAASTDTDFATTATTSVDTTAVASGIEAKSGEYAAYSITVDPAAPEVGAAVTVTVSNTNGIDSANEKETVTITYSVGTTTGLTKTLDFTKTSEAESLTFTITATDKVTITNATASNTAKASE